MKRGIALCALTIAILHPVLSLDFNDIYTFVGEPAESQTSNAGLTLFPTLIIPIGGEFEGMGQAYTAVARDVSFLDANPAASSTLEFTEITFTHNNWIADSSIDGLLYTQRARAFGFGAGGKFLHLPFTEYDERSRQVAGGRYSEGTVGLNLSYNLFRSFYFPGVAVGATVKGAYRYVPPAIAPDQSAAALAADVGLLSRFNFLKSFASRTPNFAIGASARNLGLPVEGVPLPTVITAGIAYDPIRPITIATDLILPVSFAAEVPAPPIGGAAGLSVQITRFFSLRSGVLLRWGASRFSAGATLELTDFSVDMNYNLDLGTQFRFMDRFSVQMRLNFGDEGRETLQDRVDQLYLNAWRAAASGEIDRAVELSSSALELDPDFTPAMELLALSLETIELQQTLRAIDLQSLGENLRDDQPDPSEP